MKRRRHCATAVDSVVPASDETRRRHSAHLDKCTSRRAFFLLVRRSREHSFRALPLGCFSSNAVSVFHETRCGGLRSGVLPAPSSNRLNPNWPPFVPLIPIGDLPIHPNELSRRNVI